MNNQEAVHQRQDQAWEEKREKKKVFERSIEFWKSLSPDVLEKMKPVYEKTSKMEVRPDDVFVRTMPRSGTTWTQEMVWLICNNCDTETARTVDQIFRFPCPEASMQHGKISDILKYLQDFSGPRFIKTHFPDDLLPRQLWEVNPKVVTVWRDPRDSAISQYHFIKLITRYSGSLEQFLDLYLDNTILGFDYWEAVLGLWNRRHQENVLFLTYEEMKKDLRGVILKTAEFFNKKLSEEQIARILDYLDINSMRTNPAVNREDVFIHSDRGKFIRKGETGGWRAILSDEYKEKFNNWAKKNIEGTDFPYYFY